MNLCIINLCNCDDSHISNTQKRTGEFRDLDLYAQVHLYTFDHFGLVVKHSARKQTNPALNPLQLILFLKKKLSINSQQIKGMKVVTSLPIMMHKHSVMV